MSSFASSPVQSGSETPPMGDHGAPLKVAYMFPGDVRPYRVAFLRHLAKKGEDISVVLYEGQARKLSGAPLERVGKLPFPVRRVRNVYWPGFGNRKVMWQIGALSALWSEASVIVLWEQVHSLTNLAIRLLHRPFGKNLVLHGFFYRPSGGFLATGRDAVRRWLHNSASAYICYTDRGRDAAVGEGLPPERVFVARNTIDTAELIRLGDSVDENELSTIRRRLGLDRQVMLYLGRLLPEKRPHVAIDALRLLLEAGHPISLLVVGDGSERERLERQAKRLPVVFVGPEYDSSTVARYLKLSDVLILPGRVGLTPLDAFSCEIPVVATADPSIWQSPEFDYLVPDQNCLVTSRSEPEQFAHAVSRLLSDSHLRIRLTAAGRHTAEEMSVEAMANAFTRAVLKAAGE